MGYLRSRHKVLQTNVPVSNFLTFPQPQWKAREQLEHDPET